MSRFDNLDLKSLFHSDGVPIGIAYIDIEKCYGKQYRLVDDLNSYRHTMGIMNVWPSLYDKFIENDIDIEIRVCDIFHVLPVYTFGRNSQVIFPEAFGYHYYIPEEDKRWLAEVNSEFLEFIEDFDFILNCYDGVSFKHKEEYEQALVIKQLMGNK